MHPTVDAYSLHLDTSTPKAGNRVQLIYPESDYQDYTSGFVFDLEKKNAKGEWILVAKLTSPFGQGSTEPRVIPADDRETMFAPIGRAATGSLPLLLPEDAHGSHRIVDKVTKSGPPVDRLTIAAAFEIEK